MEVIAQGKITTFPGSSKYQIMIEAMEPAGAGALMALLEERKRKLTAEGLFAESRKNKLPFLPRVVGIVTSPTGAVIRDMLHGFNERCPAHVIVWPVRVQGEGSAAEVAAAIRGFNAIAPGGPIPRPDVLIVARGGGSLEDLWGFNEEIVVRAVSESRIPLISAVGHETDWTLIDLVADARAPTPTKAAEWAVPKHGDLCDSAGDLGQRLSVAVRRAINQARTHLKAAARGLPRLEDLLALPRQRFDSSSMRLARALVANTHGHARRLAGLSPRLQPRLLAARLQRIDDGLGKLWQRGSAALARGAGSRRTRFERVGARLNGQVLDSRVRRGRDRLDGLSQMLASLSYQSVLSRGFAIVRDGEGRMLRAAAAIAPRALLEIEFADGRIAAEVMGSSLPGAATRSGSEAASAKVAAPAGAGAARPNRAPRGTGSGSGGQGSLF